YEQTRIPIVFDYHHHGFRTGDLIHEEAMMLACHTWPRTITPLVHFSSSRRRYEDPAASPASHADYVYEPINLYGMKADIMLEAKAKEMAVMRFLKNVT